MRTVTLPDVPYGTTAVRPAWFDVAREEMAWWSAIVAGRGRCPRRRRTSASWPPWSSGFRGWSTGRGMLHGDLRVDNVLIGRTGEAWLCDWTWPCLGAPWFDAVTAPGRRVAAQPAASAVQRDAGAGLAGGAAGPAEPGRAGGPC